ncbi:hypothetical protein PHJA_001746400 [Phtheirospermum japonicum]|uniref:Uncharacterized protein n=1 Tax=Phtheirospermum japonicum TaxID=374723 RepID=A0A830CJR4_9LAMI|nr:hypothetical protein PHJA_001746400 [Phtheirospermum japonicum]
MPSPARDGHQPAADDSRTHLRARGGAKCFFLSRQRGDVDDSEAAERESRDPDGAEAVQEVCRGENGPRSARDAGVG